MTKLIGLKVPDAMYEKLRKKAWGKAFSLQEYIRALLNDHLESESDATG